MLDHTLLADVAITISIDGPWNPYYVRTALFAYIISNAA